jgi:hypothetical protein
MTSNWWIRFPYYISCYMAIFFSLINVYFHLNSAWTSLLTYWRIFIKFSSHYHVVYTIFLNLVSGDQLVSITLQIVVPIYKGFVNLITNSFKTQVAILDNECGCLLVTIPRKQRYSEDWKLIFLNSVVIFTSGWQILYLITIIVSDLNGLCIYNIWFVFLFITEETSHP